MCLGQLGFLGEGALCSEDQEESVEKRRKKKTSLTVDEGPFYTFSKAPWSTTFGHHELQLDKP